MLFPEAFQPAGRRMTPSNVSPVVTKRQSAMTSLRASATIMVLRLAKAALGIIFCSAVLTTLFVWIVWH